MHFICNINIEYFVCVCVCVFGTEEPVLGFWLALLCIYIFISFIKKNPLNLILVSWSISQSISTSVIEVIEIKRAWSDLLMGLSSDAPQQTPPVCVYWHVHWDWCCFSL